MFHFVFDTLDKIEAELKQVKGFLIGIEKSNYENYNYNFRNKRIIKFKDLFERKASTKLNLNENKEVDGIMANKKPMMGSVKKLPNKNLWRGRFQYQNQSYTVYSKSWSTCFTKLEDKIKEVIKENKESKNEVFAVNKNMLFCDWWNYWINTFKKNTIKSSTLKGYTSVYKIYIEKSKINNMIICKITTFDIQDVIDKAKGAGAKITIKTKLNSCFQKLVDTHILSFNPVKGTVINFAKNKKDKKFLEKAEREKLFYYTDNHEKESYKYFGNFLKFLLYTGLRYSEAIALNWEDIDYSRKLIIVNKIFNRDKVIDTPKTVSSNRVVPLFKKTQDILEYFKSDSNIVFHKIQGLRTDNYFKIFKKQLGFKISFHMFRHTFASECLAIGINPKTIQKWLGHTKINMTMNVYVDVINELEQKDIDKFNKNS